MRVSRDDLLQQLDLVTPGLSPREVIEQSSAFVFRDGQVQTYNDEVACSCVSGLDDDFTGAVQAAPMLALLRKLSETNLDLEVEEERLVIIGKRKRTEIRMEKDIMDGSWKLEFPEEWQRLRSEFSEALNIVMHCASKDQARFLLTCVHIHPKWVEACDNFQMSRYRIKTRIQAPVLLRRDSIKHIVPLDMTEIGETESWVHFRNKAGLVISCKRYDGEYEDMTEFLKVDGGVPTTLPKGLAEATDRSEIFSKENKDDNLVTVKLREGKARVIGVGESGKHEEWKSVKYKGRPLTFLIAPSLLIQLVNSHNACEVSKEHLKIDGGKFVYIACLTRPSDVETAKKKKQIEEDD